MKLPPLPENDPARTANASKTSAPAGDALWLGAALSRFRGDLQLPLS